MSLAMKARQKVRKKATKDKTFGCDLLEHLTISGLEVPQVLRSCTEFVEEHGIVDGIYRLCGIASNVHKLRQEFDLERQPNLSKDTYLQDVHCVSSLCKAYFRELPNPLLTYQLYDKFADAVAIQLEEQRLIKIKEVMNELPLPHYRTLEYLMRHLLHMASFSSQTNMHARNLAIVWAPNLLRSKDIESSGFNGTAAFMEVRIQSIVVEFMLTHVEQLFGDMPLAGSEHCSITSVNSPSCVREDYFRSLTYNIPSVLHQGDGPPQMRPYHTIIELSDHKRKGSLKAKKWKSIFNLGRSNNDSKRKANKQDEKDSDKTGKVSLRPAKSMDSLSSVPHASDAMDSENRSLMRSRSPKSMIPLHRDSFGAQSKPGNDYTFSGEQPIQPETCNQTAYEEESKSEPTTPKPRRSSIVASPQGRSPKSAQNRAEKCLGVHISEPFSVTLPRHITSNLSRLTRGLECPSLTNPGLQRSSEKISSAEENPPQSKLVNPSIDPEDYSAIKSAMLNDIELLISEIHLDTLMPDEVTECMESDGDLVMNELKSSANSDRSLDTVQEKPGFRHPELITERDQVDPNVKGKGSPFATTDKQNPDTEKKRISLEVQDTFSFLDKPDMTAEISALDADEAEEELQGYGSGWVPGEEELRNAYMTDMITSCVQTEEFSVEPPPDDLSTEDDEDMYSMPADCLDILENSKDIDNNSDDIFLSAYDELSPLAHETSTMFVVENSTDLLTNETELDKSICQNLNSDSNWDVNKATQLELEAPIMQHTINISTEALQDSMEDPSVQDGGSYIPETNATSEKDKSKHGLMQCKDSTELLHASLQKAHLHLLNLGFKTTDNKQVSKPAPCLDLNMFMLDMQQENSKGLVCSAECDGTSADNMQLTDCVRPASEKVLLTDTSALENVLLIDTPASESVLLTETPASENVLLTETPASESVLLTDTSASENVLLIDTPASESVLLIDTPTSVLLTDTPAAENILLTDIPASEHVLLTDTPASEHFLLTDIPASEHVLLTDTPVSENVLLTDIPASEHVLLTDTPASENTLLTDTPVSENIILRDKPASKNILLTDKPASKNILLTDIPASENILLTDTPVSENILLVSENIPLIDTPVSENILLTDPPASEHVLLTETTDSVQQVEGLDHKHLTKCSDQDTSICRQVTPLEKTEIELIPAVFPDGSVSMTLSTTPHRIHQVKSVPVVPPKPQFAKLPPALKSKIHVSPASNKSKDMGSQKTDSITTVEVGNPCSQSPQGKMRSSWKSGGSISFDTAVAQARERQMSQYPIRRMQTYCVGESHHVLDTTKEDVTLHRQKVAQKQGGGRPHSCVVALNSLEVTIKGNNIDEDTKRSQLLQDCKYVMSQEAIMAPDGQSLWNRQSMSRLGKQTSTEELSETCQKPQRRSLL
ncbi:hypothetical protein XELAEV_18043038mg [Xenopus laevis]|uniref:Rho-GAP domain-containing protein n=2 Tax=Xenopus laevis TaxID=8355 RepID=A0A974C5A0_XENLA|nr:hypothetical protein XELAEV_18043038mg [Xenopus laevis]